MVAVEQTSPAVVTTPTTAIEEAAVVRSPTVSVLLAFVKSPGRAGDYVSQTSVICATGSPSVPVQPVETTRTITACVPR